MNYHHHNQYPFTAEMKRRLFIARRERRAAAAWDFIKNFAAAALIVAFVLLLGAVLDR